MAVTRGGETAGDAYVSQNALERSSGQRRDLPGELELDQRDGDRARFEAGALGERVDPGGIVTKRREHLRGVATGRGLTGLGSRGGGRRRQPKFLEHVLRGLNELGAILDQPMAAFGKR